ncbi:MAG: 3-hydroxyacyl-CoA dehydrogenase family protein [Lachnospiraceae bacterium]|nr:3-hydroxyacyl-CoA dehydrogenase family protein [Lachnospiraceae bacterium]
MSDIRNVLIMGGGMMGSNIAYVVASVKEFQITVYDKFPVDLEGKIRTNTKQLVDKGIETEAALAEKLSRIHFTQDIEDEGIKNADLVIEAVFEDINVKQETFALLEEKCRPDCIFCTNSSVMSPSWISEKLQYRTRFVGTHFWNPGHLIPLVEVVKTDATSDEVADTVMDFMKRIGKSPCLCKKDVPGFIANRMQHALWREAISIVENGIASAEDVDTAVKTSFGLRLPYLPPLLNSDMVGTQLTYNIHSTVLDAIEDSHKPSPLLEEMIKKGEMGFRAEPNAEGKRVGFGAYTDEEIADINAGLNEYLIKMLYNK